MTNKFDYVKTRREDVDEIPTKMVPLVRRVMKVYTRFNVWVYKKSNGRLLKNFPGGYPICIVTMVGRKSGQPREIALINLPQGENRYLVASQGGMEKNPVWYYNIAANPDVEIMVGGLKKPYRARQVSPDEKREAWPHLLTLYPGFDEYQARTDRDIPVFICEPR
ncbi:nitroreductase family deazaflavin-dependent oxidoreductase [Kineobactrum sediminis]|uniref:Nitroreductase family deazaflavin-dependent oxidoreductase n=1 Tax=Kineobactrum sediminis TaxID=1905677 RepID=A0A2N5Y283_9GAMM|nr:nitroreductase family deazaflavin-dependent oxidoreductase [Kineobactrum sediminis]PLW82510.1 nitroreductase family deazaflavin-dependent oxidoreductase [Kineobactrum sediminis]